VFRALYAQVTRAADSEADVCGVRLYVERENLVAQSTYRNLGMGETDYLLFEELKAGIMWLAQDGADQPSSSR
jgi:ribosomal protein S18 acetylase RimI-like enzyme